MNRISRSLLLLGLSAVTMCAATYAKASKGSWEILRIADSTVYFKNGDKVVAPGLYDVKFLGQLKNNKNAQLMLFAGKDCKDCDASNAVFIYSTADKKIVIPEYAPYDYPGTEYDAADSTVLYNTRMFYGKVLPNVENGIIWYQNMLTDYGYQKSVYLIKVEKNKIKEQLLVENIPSIEDTLKLVDQKACYEVPSMDYTVDASME
ncbi:MAG: hypothetical protein EOP53_27860 [Sphingobacteriales bacterium]|nr:MAG: hypothetical protein EOP53_27860 [Sphingobacteriales bacterium]